MTSIDNGASVNGSSVEAAADVRAIGDRHRDARRWPAAAAAYCRYLEDYPEDAAVWVRAGNCFKEAAIAADPAGFRDADIARSLAAYRKAIQLSPNNLEAHRQLGHLYKLIGNTAEARASYERAGMLDPDPARMPDETHDLEVVQALRPRMPAGFRQSVAVTELLSALRQLPREQDPFVTYFNAVGGGHVDKTT